MQVTMDESEIEKAVVEYLERRGVRPQEDGVHFQGSEDDEDGYRAVVDVAEPPAPAKRVRAPKGPKAVP